MCFIMRFGGLHFCKAVVTFESPFLYVIVGGSLVIYMLETKFFVSFARRGRDEAKTILGAVGLHITDLIFQAIN